MLSHDLIIVNKDSDGLLRRCLCSVEASILAFAAIRTVTVVDNASQDGSADGLRPFLPLTVLRLGENIGFGSACNLAAKRGCAEYILLLNPDVSLPPEALSRALCAASEDGADLLGIRLSDECGHPVASRLRFPRPADFVARALGLHRLFPRRFADYHAVDQAHSGEADCVLGAFLLIRRAAFEAVEGFDERFFLYFEEIDLAQRLKRAGFRIAYCAQTAATHTGGCGHSANEPFRLEQSVRSRMLYAKRYFSPIKCALLALFTFSIEPFARALYALFRGENPFPVLLAYAKAAFRAHRHMRAAEKARRAMHLTTHKSPRKEIP